MASKWLASFRQAEGSDFDASTPVPKCQKSQKGIFDNSGISAWLKTENDSPDAMLVEWSDGVSQLGMIARPACIRAARWRQMVVEAGHFLRDWSAQASVLGWTTLDIFGVHRTHPVGRIDCAGLVVLLCGAEVVAIASVTVCTRNPTGATLNYCRRPLRESVPLWELRSGRTRQGQDEV